MFCFASKEPTVPRSDPPLFVLSFAEQTKEPTVENEFCEEEGPREPRFPSKGGSLRGTVGSLDKDEDSFSLHATWAYLEQPTTPPPTHIHADTLSKLVQLYKCVHSACKEGFEAVLTHAMSVELFSQVVGAPMNKSTPLELALLHRRLNVAILLLESNLSTVSLNLQHKDARGNTAVDYACACNDQKVLSLVIQRLFGQA